MDGYKHIDDMPLEKLIEAAEDEGYYYLKFQSDEYYDDSMWKVDKNTGEATYIDYTKYIVDVHEFATELDPKTFKRVS